MLKQHIQFGPELTHITKMLKQYVHFGPELIHITHMLEWILSNMCNLGFSCHTYKSDA